MNSGFAYSATVGCGGKEGVVGDPCEAIHHALGFHDYLWLMYIVTSKPKRTSLYSGVCHFISEFLRICE